VLALLLIGSKMCQAFMDHSVSYMDHHHFESQKTKVVKMEQVTAWTLSFRKTRPPTREAFVI